ncbi:MAG: hypothetical protein K2P81_10195 [Bacteriovoracaceae bacterium]|nr:hypothetical protein [Bacteriovoracaceae bacterium]
MDSKIISFDLYTTHPEELERFLSDVIAADIQTGPGLFTAVFESLSINVYEGISPAINIQLLIEPQSFSELRSRFEFYQFRQENLMQASFSETLNVFKGIDGHIWSTIPTQLHHTRENSSISVRNC